MVYPVITGYQGGQPRQLDTTIRPTFQNAGSIAPGVWSSLTPAQQQQYTAATPEQQAAMRQQMTVGAMTGNGGSQPIQTRFDTVMNPTPPNLAEAQAGFVTGGGQTAASAQQNLQNQYQQQVALSQQTIPTQTPGQFTGMDVSQYQGGLLGGGQQGGGLLGPQALYPTYGQPNQVHYPNGFGVGQRPWMMNGSEQATNQINNYLQSQRNPADMGVPNTIDSFDRWRQGEYMGRGALDTDLMAQQYLERELARLERERQQSNPDNGNPAGTFDG